MPDDLDQPIRTNEDLSPEDLPNIEDSIDGGAPQPPQSDAGPAELDQAALEAESVGGGDAPAEGLSQAYKVPMPPKNIKSAEEVHPDDLKVEELDNLELSGVRDKPGAQSDSTETKLDNVVALSDHEGFEDVPDSKTPLATPQHQPLIEQTRVGSSAAGVPAEQQKTGTYSPQEQQAAAPQKTPAPSINNELDWIPPQKAVLDDVYAASVDDESDDGYVSNDDPAANNRMRVPGYEMGSEISRGGQAVVYRGRQQSTGQRVAIKVMRNGPFASEDQKARFDREVQCLASLNHPNIVGIIDCGQTPEGFFYYVMEFIEGRTLDDYAAELRGKTPPADIPQNPSELLRLFMRICDAVNVAHQEGVVHRDLKPSNILIDKNGEPRILDFGLAQRFDEHGQRMGQPLTITGEFLGSLPWASPEQAESDPSKIDARTDVYALGVILFQILTNEFPYEVVGNMAVVLHNIVNAAPRSPSRVMDARIAQAAERAKKMRQRLENPINREMEAIILKALSKRREDRYDDAGAFSQELGKYLSGMMTNAGSQQKKKSGSFKWAAILIILFLISGTAAAAYVKPELFPKQVQDFVAKLKQPADERGQLVVDDAGNADPVNGDNTSQSDSSTSTGANNTTDKVEPGNVMPPDNGKVESTGTEKTGAGNTDAGKTDTGKVDAGKAAVAPDPFDDNPPVNKTPTVEKKVAPNNTTNKTPVTPVKKDPASKTDAGKVTPPDKGKAVNVDPKPDTDKVTTPDTPDASKTSGQKQATDKTVNPGKSLAVNVTKDPIDKTKTQPDKVKPPKMALPPDSDTSTRGWPLGKVSDWQRDWAKKHGVKPVLTNQLGMTMLLIPPGTYQRPALNVTDGMASSLASFAGEPLPVSSSGETLTFKVDKAFYISATPVTQLQFKKLMPDHPYAKAPKGVSPDHMPVQQINWFEAMAFAHRLSRKESAQYRLPSVMEWEYVADPLGKTQIRTKGKGNVFSHDPSPYGVFGLSSGHMEWCLDSGMVLMNRETGGPDSHEFELNFKSQYDYRHSWRVLKGTGKPKRNVWLAAADYTDLSAGFRLVQEMKPAQAAAKDKPNSDSLTRAYAEASDKLVRAFKGDHPGDHWEALTQAREANKLVGRLPEAQKLLLRLDGYSRIRHTDHKINDQVKLRTVYLPAGDFLMGSPDQEPGRETDEAQRRIHLSLGFQMSETEITRGQWFAVMGDYKGLVLPPSNLSREEADRLPAAGMVWEEADTFCGRLTRLTGKFFQLPTEAHWEYASRGGLATRYAGGRRDDLLHRYGNYADASSHPDINGRDARRQDGYAGIAPVKSYRPNYWGLYDMHGNLMEWCKDFYGEYDLEAVSDPEGPESGTHHVLRGGAWGMSPVVARFAARQAAEDGATSDQIGFRVIIIEGDATDKRIQKEWAKVKALDQLGKAKDTMRTLDLLVFDSKGRMQKAARDLSRKVTRYSKAKTYQNSKGINFIEVPAGEFKMGSPDDEPGHRRDEGLHDAKIEKPIFVSVTEVTQAQFKPFAAMNGLLWRPKTSMPGVSKSQLDQLPATGISYDQAVAYCKWLSDEESMKYRLPTEKEWEYFARAGTQTVYPWGDKVGELDEAVLKASGKHAPWQTSPLYGNALDISRRHEYPFEAHFPWSDGYPELAPVGQFRANGFGLQDVFGNAAEWTSSTYRGYPYRGGDGREDASSRERRVLRGVMTSPVSSRLARRIAREPDEIVPEAGIRLVIESK